MAKAGAQKKSGAGKKKTFKNTTITNLQDFLTTFDHRDITGDGELKLYSLYSPPEHPDGTVHRTKEEAEAAEAAQHG